MDLMQNKHRRGSQSEHNMVKQTDFRPVKDETRSYCILSPNLFNLYARYILKKSGLENSKYRFKIQSRNITNLQYADDVTLITENANDMQAPKNESKRAPIEKLRLRLNINMTKLMKRAALKLTNKHTEVVDSFYLSGLPTNSKAAVKKYTAD